jgi:hypothetical protein
MCSDLAMSLKFRVEDVVLLLSLGCILLFVWYGFGHSINQNVYLLQKPYEDVKSGKCT